jgi:ribonuclease D
MKLITDAAELAELCTRLKSEPYITIDTEFLRDKTYWPQLCLVQVAGAKEAVAIDPLVGMDLAPLAELLANPDVIKVFHAARQDVEIFYQLTGTIPHPLFDTQVAAMVCGFGDSVGYETLAGKLAGAKIDKSLRFTDWSNRPLSDKQLHYAISDVTHLRIVYEKLSARLAKSGRSSWLEEEMAILTDPNTYRLSPEEAWARLKPRSNSPKFLNVLRELAAWRESEAQRRNVPRNRILRDEALLEVAALLPQSIADLSRSRSVGKSVAEGALGSVMIEVVARGLARPPSDAPVLAERLEVPQGRGPLIELLKVLLKLKSESNDVAQKLIANVADLEAIACSDQADVPALKGWRLEVFGDDALALKQGRLALTAGNDAIRIIRL